MDGFRDELLCMMSGDNCVTRNAVGVYDMEGVGF